MDQNFFDVLIESKNARSSWHLYPIILKDKYKARRKSIFDILRSKGILANIHYIPVYLQPYYRQLGYKKQTCVQAEDFYKRVISIPIYPSMSEEDVTYVNKVLIESFKDK